MIWPGEAGDLADAIETHIATQGGHSGEIPGTVDAMGMLNVPCKVRDGWLYIPHADGNWVTAAKLVPFSLAILANKFPDAAIAKTGGEG
jgi:hypothetical protein